MARGSVTITAVPIETATVRPAGLTVVQADGATIPAAGDTRKLLIEFNQTDATARVATIVKGAGAQAVRSGIGNLVTVGTQNVPEYVILESARFAQADGSIHIDFAASWAGTVRAYRLP
jgi:ribosome-binding ATPase YchF (GTP1/OBG family)